MKQELTLLTRERQELYLELENLPKHKLETLSAVANQIKNEKYDRKKKYRYGDLDRSYSKEELIKLFKNIYRKNTKKIFLIQFFYALRIGEIYTLQYLKEQKLLKIYNQKKRRIEYLPVHGETYKLFEELPTMPQIDNLRKIFKISNKKAGLEYIYYQNKDMKLRRFTTHSLRRTAITLFMNYTNNILKAVKFGRWKPEGGREIGSLPSYYYYNMEAMRKDLEQTFKAYYKLINQVFIYK